MENIPIGESELFIKNILSQASKYCGDFRKPLYHYTTAKGLKGIINDGEIWASHYKFTNDPSEIQYSYKLIVEILELYIKKENDTRIKSFFENYLNLQRNIIEIEKNYSSYNIFLASFSEKKDLLSQWRGYGDNAFGYCIGIDLYKTCRKSAGLSSFQVKNLSKVNLIKIIYNENKQMKIILNYLDQLKEFVKGKKDLKENSGLLYGIYLTIFPLIACLLKDPHFEEEEEWRLIYAPLVFIKNDKLKKDELTINYRTNNKVIIPYVKMNITNENSNLIPVNEIIFGPRSDETKARTGLEILLEDKGYPDDTISKIHKSGIPLT